MKFMDAILVVEELAKVDPAISVLCDVQNTLVNTIILRYPSPVIRACECRYGSKEVKEKYLPGLATDTVGCFCLSEESSGSDAFALKTVAEKQKDGSYIVNGTKMWITNSAEANVFLVFANVDPAQGYKGITCFLMERTDPGLVVAKKERKLGIRASSTCSLAFENVRVGKERIVGQVGQGYKIAIEMLNEGRIGIAAQMIGLAKGVFNHTLPYLTQRQQFGQTLAQFQVLRNSYSRECNINLLRLEQKSKPLLC